MFSNAAIHIFFGECIFYLGFKIVGIALQEAATGGGLIWKGVLRNFAKYTGKQLCRSLVFNRVAGLRFVTLLQKDNNTGIFFEFCKVFKSTFFTEQLRTTASVILRTILSKDKPEISPKFKNMSKNIIG